MTRRWHLALDDCREFLCGLPDGCADAVVTDPPAGINFMGRAWDRFSGRAAFVTFMTDVMAECLRVLKPGGHAFVWALPKTAHWTTWAVEDAGFEIRDVVVHLFGQGMPKSLALLKPAAEHWILARKLLTSTVAANVLAHGTGSLNIDACRVDGGRHPANVVLDEVAAEALDLQSGILTSGAMASGTVRAVRDGVVYGKLGPIATTQDIVASSGGASRFFYVGKASTKDKTSDGLIDNDHPTPKNTALMRWLCRLVTPPGGLVVDPFTGSGSTGVACALEGFQFLGVDADPVSDNTSLHRIAHAYGDFMPDTDISPPFLRWVGGKRRQAVDLAARVEAARGCYGRHIEPFFGSGAVALALPSGSRMIAGDACKPLGYLWWWLQRSPSAVAEYAAGFGLDIDHGWNTRDGYLVAREDHNAEPWSDDDYRPSARFLWLLCACFNGIYRENRAGNFNVPWGKRKRVSVPTADVLVEIADRLRYADVRPGWDFADVIAEAGPGDVIFNDPPYDGVDGVFTSYVAAPFDRESQRRLRDVSVSAVGRGATVIMTNADTPYIRELYEGWQIETVTEQRPVAASPVARVPAHCVIVTGTPTVLGAAATHYPF